MKKEKQPSDTGKIRIALPPILKKHPEGLTFEELWNFLYEDENLAKIMVNKENKKRLGLLQGLTNRIKDNKEENILLIKKEDGKNYYIYYDNSIDKLIKTTDLYISSVNKIQIEKSDISKEKQKILEEFYQSIESLQFLTKKLENKSVNKSEIETKPKTKPKIKETTTTTK